MSNHHSGKRAGLLLCLILGVFIFLRPLWAGGEKSGERKSEFSAGAAVFSLKFDAAEPLLPAAIATSQFSLSRIHPLGERFSESSQMPELEPVETYGSFFGIKITLQLKGGWHVYSGGDLEAGLGGMYDSAVDLITTSGVPIQRSLKKTGHSGLEFGGDIIYCITPRFGIGIGGSRFSAKNESVLYYEINSPDYDTLRAKPIISVTVLRLCLHYAFPFAGRLAISVHGGPALYSAEYEYTQGVTTGGYGLPSVLEGRLPAGLSQDAKAKKLGLEGGLGFEFNANPFVAFFIEALGRYARIEDLEGVEQTHFYAGGSWQAIQQEGVVYFVPTDSFPLLDVVPSESSAGAAARKATLDFSGFSFSAGLKLRF
jgi:hypothetical protein